VTQGEERTRWKIHSDRVVDENRHVRLSVASVEPRAPNPTEWAGLDISCGQRVGSSRPGSWLTLTWVLVLGWAAVALPARYGPGGGVKMSSVPMRRQMTCGWPGTRSAP
jgi:hypothetical protein